MARTVEGGSGVLQVDPFQGRGEAVRVTLAPDFAVGDDVEAGFFLGAYSQDRGVILGLAQERLGDAPQRLHPDARREASGKARPVDQPVGLRITSHQRRWKQHPSSPLNLICESTVSHALRRCILSAWSVHGAEWDDAEAAAQTGNSPRRPD